MEWYPLVNVYIAKWKDPPCWMGKFTISTGPFSIANCNKLPEGTFAWAFWKKQHVLEHLQWVSVIGDLDIIMRCSWNTDVQMPIFLFTVLFFYSIWTVLTVNDSAIGDSQSNRLFFSALNLLLAGISHFQHRCHRGHVDWADQDCWHPSLQVDFLAVSQRNWPGAQMVELSDARPSSWLSEWGAITQRRVIQILWFFCC